MFSLPRGKFVTVLKIAMRVLDARQGWIWGEAKIICDHGGVACKRCRFVGKRLEPRNLALEIGRLQGDPPHPEIEMAIERSDGFREAGEPLDQPCVFGEFLASPMRRFLDQARIWGKPARRRRDLDRKRLIRRHCGIADLRVEAFRDLVQAVTRRGQLPSRHPSRRQDRRGRARRQYPFSRPRIPALVRG